MPLIRLSRAPSGESLRYGVLLRVLLALLTFLALQAQDLSSIRQLIDGGNYGEAVRRASAAYQARASAATGQALVEAILADRNSDFERAHTLATDWVQRARAGGDRVNLAEALTALGSVLRLQGEPFEGREPLQEATEILLAERGNSDPLTADTLAELGALLIDISEFTLARTFLGNSLQIRQTSFGEGSLPVADSYYWLGLLAQEQQQDAEAEAALERSLNLRKALLPADHPLLADSLQAMGTLAELQSKFEAATEFYRQAFAIRDKVLGQHLLTAETAESLGRVLEGTPQRGAGEALMQRGLQIREQRLGADSIPVAISLNQLGSFWRRNGSPEKARGAFQRAFQIMRQKRGEIHYDVATSLNNLAITNWDLRSFQEGLEQLQQVADMWGSLDAWREQAYALVNQGELLWDWGRLTQASPYFEQALKLRRDRSAPPVLISETVERLAQLLLEIGNYETAFPLFEEVLQDRIAALGPEHGLVAQALENLGQIERARGNYREAMDYHQQALAMRQELMGETHPLVASTRESLGLVQQALGHFKEAEDYFRQAYATRELVYGQNSPGLLPGLRLFLSLEIDKGNYPAGQQYVAQARAIVNASLGPEHAEAAGLDIREADLMLVMGQPQAARPLYQRALEILESSLGPSHPSLAAILNNLGNLDRQDASYQAAQANYQRALDIYRESYGESSPSSLTAKSSLAAVLFETGDYPPAAELYESVYRDLGGNLGESHPQVAAAASNLGRLRQVQGRYQEAEALLRRALQIREARFGPDHPLVADSCDGLASLLAERGEGSQARPLFERALAISEKTVGPQHPSVASSLQNLAGLLAEFNDLHGAQELVERALAIRRQTLGENHPLVAGSLNGLAEVKRQSGEFAAARPLYEQALAIWRAALGDEHPAVASGLANLATLNRQSGDYAQAEQQLQQALGILQGKLGADHPQVAAIQFDLAETLRGAGRTQEASAMADQALQILASKLDPDHPRLANSMIQVANTARDSGDLNRARSLYQQAQAIFVKAYGEQSLQVAAVVHSLAILAHREGRLDEAGQNYQRSLAIWKATLGEANPSVAVGELNLAALQAAGGQLVPAFNAALDAEQVGRNHLRLTIRTLPERQALRYAAVRVSGKDLALTLVAERRDQIPGAVEKAWDAVVRSRAVVLDEMALRRRVLYDASSAEVSALLDQFRRVGEELAGWTVLGPGRDSAAAYKKRLDELTARRESLEQQLARYSSNANKEVSADIGLAQIRAGLPADSVLVSYVRYRSYPLAGYQMAPWHYLAFIARSSGPIVTVPLGSATEIDPLVADWYHEASRGIINQLWAQEEAETLYRTVAEKLRVRIWDPIEANLAGAERVMIVPDGALNFVSFQSLPRASGGYLIEDSRAIHYLAAERDLTRSQEPGSGRGLLVLGGASFDAARAAAAAPPATSSSSSCSPFDLVRFGALPGALEEASSVTQAWNAAAAGPVDELTGDRAGEREFKELAPGRSVIHLATHGFVLGDNCRGEGEQSADLLLESNLGEQPVENPLLRSGLALAGANSRASSGDGDDGILTADEVATLDLQGVNWAVLSACNTGIGRLQDGEGVMGLRRAFQIAGVRTLVMSLWPVDDDSTRELMTALYQQRFGQRLDAARSLRAAGLKLLRERRAAGLPGHPFFWAAFVAAGNWN